MTVGAFRIYVTKNRWKDCDLALRRASTAALDQMAAEIADDVADAAVAKGLFRTGKYAASWTVQRPSENERWAISEGAPYGAYLEYGHRVVRGGEQVGWVPPRPHARPTADAWKLRIKNRFLELFQRYWRRFDPV